MRRRGSLGDLIGMIIYFYVGAILLKEFYYPYIAPELQGTSWGWTVNVIPLVFALTPILYFVFRYVAPQYLGVLSGEFLGRIRGGGGGEEGDELPPI